MLRGSLADKAVETMSKADDFKKEGVLITLFLTTFYILNIYLLTKKRYKDN